MIIEYGAYVASTVVCSGSESGQSEPPSAVWNRRLEAQLNPFDTSAMRTCNPMRSARLKRPDAGSHVIRLREAYEFGDGRLTADPKPAPQRAKSATAPRKPRPPGKPTRASSSSDLVFAGREGPRVPGERERQIFAQASRLFVEKGYAATSMSDIAEAVKITKAGLYHFVKGKEDLLFTIMNFGMDELFDEVVNPARLVADPEERLRLIIRNHLTNIGRVSSRSGNPVTIVADEPSGLGPKKRRIITARKREYFDLIFDTLAELKARGDARPDLDVAVAAHCIVGSVLWMARWRKPNGRLGLDEIVNQITALHVGGIMRR